MCKPIALLLAGLILSPVMAEAAACQLDQATFHGVSGEVAAPP